MERDFSPFHPQNRPEMWTEKEIPGGLPGISVIAL
jgi:hypothetical protein